jgi:1,3-beta-glucan synthase
MLGFRDPIAVVVNMVVRNCSDKYFGSALCSHQALSTLATMYIMDLVLFFLDTFLWYDIWNTGFSFARSFKLGLSIWTRWEDIFTRLPKRIYAELLATGDMEVNYKPKVMSISPVIYLFGLLKFGAAGSCKSDLECDYHLDVSRAIPFD